MGTVFFNEIDSDAQGIFAADGADDACTVTWTSSVSIRMLCPTA